jgi:hypothetical protein
MKNLCLAILSLSLLNAASSAQDRAGAQSKGTADQSQGVEGGATPKVSRGLTLRAELTKSIDAKKAKVGDEVVAKTLDDLLSNGQVVVPRGSKISGRVVEVKPRQGNEESLLGIKLETLTMRDGAQQSLNATIQAIGKPETALANEPMVERGTAGSPSPGSGGRMGGMGQGTGSPAGYPSAGSADTGGYGAQDRAPSAGSGELSANAQGVIGISDLSLDQGTAQDTVVTSAKHNVKLESGTQMVLHVNP